MYIEEVNKASGCTLKLSCHDPATKALYDFDVNVMKDKALSFKINMLMSQRRVKHYITIDNFEYDRKIIDFDAHNVECSLFLTIKSGKVYCWEDVGVHPVNIGGKDVINITSSISVMPYDRRNYPRYPIECEGEVKWANSNSEKCVVKDISMEGIGILIEATDAPHHKGQQATVTWEETAGFDNSGSVTKRALSVNARVVRRQTMADGKIVIGMELEAKSRSTQEYIDWISLNKGMI